MSIKAIRTPVIVDGHAVGEAYDWRSPGCEYRVYIPDGLKLVKRERFFKNHDDVVRFVRNRLAVITK